MSHSRATWNVRFTLVVSVSSPTVLLAVQTTCISLPSYCAGTRNDFHPGPSTSDVIDGSMRILGVGFPRAWHFISSPTATWLPRGRNFTSFTKSACQQTNTTCKITSHHECDWSRQRHVPCDKIDCCMPWLAISNRCGVWLYNENSICRPAPLLNFTASTECHEWCR